MKILHIITGLQKAAGTSVFCGELANEMVRHGHAVTVATVAIGEFDFLLDSRVKRATIRNVIAEEDWDVVHIHGLWSPILHRVSRWAHGKGYRVVWSPHGMLAPWAMAHKRWKKLIPWWIYQKRDLQLADAIHVTTELEETWVRNLGFKNKIVIAPLGTHLPQCSGSGCRKPQEKKTLLFVGRIYPVKGIECLLKAWSMVEESDREGWKVRLVGPDQAGYMATMKRLAKELGVSGQVEFVGPKYDDELNAEYMNADLLTLPSFTENFGGVVIDALANGVPVIASKYTPWKELESVPKCGWWCDNEPVRFARTLREAITLSDEERKAMGIRGRKLVEEKYTWEAVCKAMVEGYKGVVEELKG